MKNPVVVVGIGEMGSVFARGFLRLGHPVYPVVRDAGMAETAGRLTDPELVVIAVAEKDLQAVLRAVPEAWRDRLYMPLEPGPPGLNCCTIGGSQYTSCEARWADERSGRCRKPLVRRWARG